MPRAQIILEERKKSQHEVSALLSDKKQIKRVQVMHHLQPQTVSNQITLYSLKLSFLQAGSEYLVLQTNC